MCLVSLLCSDVFTFYLPPSFITDVCHISHLTGLPPSLAAQVVHSAGRRFIVSPVPEARLREPLFGPPSANTSFEDSAPGLIYTSAESLLKHISNIQTEFIHAFSFPASDPTLASNVQQEQANFAPGSTQISVIPATPGGLAPESYIPPPQSLYQSAVPAATATLIPVTTQVTTPTPSTTQPTSTGRMSPSPATTESPAPRRLSLPTPSQTPQNIVGQQAENSGLDQTQPTVQQVQVGPSSVPLTQPTGTGDGESDVQGKPPGIEDIHALDQKLRSLFKDSSQSSTQPDGSGEPATSSPPNTISTNTPGLVSSVTPPSLSLNSSGNFAPGAFASVGTPASCVQTSSAEPSPQKPQVGKVAK